MIRKVAILILTGICVISSADPESTSQAAQGDLRKVVHITNQDVNEATQLIKGRDATEDEIRRSKDFLRNNSLPSSFKERKVLVEKLIETTFQEDSVTNKDRSKVMRLLYRKEREAQEQRAANGVADRDKPAKRDNDDGKQVKETSKSVAEANNKALNENAQRIPNTFLNDTSLNAQEIAEIAQIVRPPAASDSGPAAAPQTAPAAQAAAPVDEEPVQQQVATRGGHSGPAPAVVPLILPDPIVMLPGSPAVAPLSSVTNFNPAGLKSNLEKILEDRVRTGEISPEQGKQVMKDVLNDFEGDRGSKETKLPRTAQTDAAKTTPEAIPGGVPVSEPVGVKKDSLLKPQGITVFGNSGESATTTIPLAGANSDLVANEMSKILTDFGKLSLEPDGGKGKKLGDGATGKSGGMVGVMSASGGGPIAPSDNSGNTPAIVTKSGGTLVLAAKESAAAPVPAAASKGWLNDLISKYLTGKGKGFRALASPMKSGSGLPEGSLSPKEQAAAIFVPDELGIVEASPVAPADASDDAKWFLWIGGAALSLSAYWAMRRRNEESTESDDERQAS